MFVLLIIFIWLVWLGVRAWLRRNDPEGLAILTGEAPPAEVAPPAPPVHQVTPPGVGALMPRTPVAYGQVEAYNRRRVERRRTAVPLPDSADRRTGLDRRSA